MLPPTKILISTDDNILSFIRTIKLKTGELVYRYVFVKSFEKMGIEVDFSEGEIKKQLNAFFKIIE